MSELSTYAIKMFGFDEPFRFRFCSRSRFRFRKFPPTHITCPLPLLRIYTPMSIPKFVNGDYAVNRLAVYLRDCYGLFCTAIKVDESEK